MRLGAFVITYHRPAILRDTLQSILKQTRRPELILVVDNGNAPQTETVVKEFAPNNVVLERMPQNEGPAGAAAFGMQWLFDRGFDLLYWVDDDNPPQFDLTIERLLELIQSVDSETLGGVATVGSLWDWKKGELKRLRNQDLNGVVEVDAIGGGQQLILKRIVVEKIGLPDSRLFFGLEEIEYCLRIRRAGFSLVVDGGFMAEHRKRAGRWDLQIRQTPVPRYPFESIWRRYYTTRNYIFLMNHTFHRPGLARREMLKSLVRVFACWKKGIRYGATFTKLQLLGVVDGYRGRMGRTITPRTVQ